jgi:putative oxidoreductase
MAQDITPDDVMHVPTRGESRPGVATRGFLGSAVGVTLGCVFLGAGISKLVRPDFLVETFTGWGYPLWFLYVVGLVEILGAVLVLIPASRVAGASIIACVMLGAIGTHLMAGQLVMALVPAAMLALAALLLFPLRPRFVVEPVGEDHGMPARSAKSGGP